MIISHQHRFIFIKTRKTAGTSIEVYLSALCADSDVLTPIVPVEAGHQPRNHAGFSNHIPAYQVREQVGPEIWNSYFKFCVERSPWDKSLSHFWWLKAQRPEAPPTLAAYFERGDFCSDWPLYTDPATGQLLVDQVLRYEQLNQDLAQVFQRLGLPFTGDLGIRAKSGARGDTRSYRDILTPAQAAQIRQHYAREIAYFGYTQDDPYPQEPA